MQKPDYKEASLNISQFQEIYQSISQMIMSIENINKQAENGIINLKQPIVQEKLNAMKENQSDGNSHSEGEIFQLTDILLGNNLNNDQAKIKKMIYINKHYDEDIQIILNKKDRINSVDSTIHQLKFNALFNIKWFVMTKKQKQMIISQLDQAENFINEFQEMFEKQIPKLKSGVEKGNEQINLDYEQNESEYYLFLNKQFKVDKALITRQEFENFRIKHDNLTTIHTNIMQNYRDESSYNYQIKELIKKVKVKEVEEEFYNTTINEFSEIYDASKMRAAILKENNIISLYDLVSFEPLETIDGIGFVTGTYIREILEQYKDKIQDSVGIQFNISEKTHAQTELLRYLYPIVHNKNIFNELKEAHEYYRRQNIYVLLEQVNIRTEWDLQQTYKDEKNLVGFETILLKLQKDLKDINLKSERYKLLISNSNKVSPTILWEDFTKNAGDYYAILEREFNQNKVQKEEQMKKSALSQTIIKKIEDFKLNENNLNGTLRSWQDFGAKYSLIQKKVLIGDEMGLGKTLTTIVSMVHLAEQGKRRFFVIVPASIIVNWKREVQKFSNLSVYIIHGLNRDSLLDTWYENGGVAVTTYDTAWRLDFDDISHIDMVVADEAHYIKNPQAKRSKIVYELTDRSEYATYLSGTPLENRVSDMTNIIKPLQPTIAYQLKMPRVKERNEVYRKTIAPVYLRRTIEDVKLELPDLSQIEEWEEFGKEELDYYKEAVARGNFMMMRRAAWMGGSPNKSPKLERLIELCKEAKENNQKVLIFTFFRDVIEVITDALDGQIVEAIQGGVSHERRQEIIDEFRDSTEKNVLIAQINTAAHGLNIQFANIVIFCEPQIKPSLESQAVARAYRMGQVNNVFVYRLLTENSIDEQMMEMLGNKQALFDAYAHKAYITEEALSQDTDEEVEIEENIQTKIIDLERRRLGVQPKENTDELLVK
ncbi:DEAD/DEAH box helicase [Aerococcaceae bacterium DSM 111021]|nr:DEAD/DEAH box helicase [Aerococcaceae bacterium DSM 111021]